MRLKNTLARASEEINKFDKTKNPLHLEQAGEKIWLAFNVFVQGKFKKKVKSFTDLKKVVFDSRDPFLIDVFNEAYNLHRFFYQGFRTEDDFVTERDDVVKVLKKVKTLAEN